MTSPIKGLLRFSTAVNTKPSIKILIKKYGPAAFITYHMISTTSLSIWFSAVHFGMDTDAVLDKMYQAKDWIMGRPHKQLQGREKPHITESSYNWKDFTTEFVLAYTFHKLLFPFRLGLTAVWTPTIAAIFKQKGWDFWRKWRKFQ